MLAAVKAAFIIEAARQSAIVSGARIRPSATAFEQGLQQRHAEEQDDPWIWHDDVLDGNLKLEKKSWQSKATDHAILGKFYPTYVEGCHHWNVLFWPQISFLSQEVRRRVQALPDEVSLAKRAELRVFAKKLAFLTCADVLDPRNGTEYSAPVLQLWEQLASAPATSLDVPEMTSFFQERKQDINAIGACMSWTEALTCDLGYSAELMAGNMQSSAKCWNTLQRPKSYHEPSEIVTVDLTGISETYLACQEHPLTSDFIQRMCPYHGHVPEGKYGRQYWGEAPEKGSVEYADIMKCNRKLGIPDADYPKEDLLGGPDGFLKTYDHVGF